MGRTTCQIFLKNQKIDYTGITTDGIEKKDFLSENRKKLNITTLLLIKMENYPGLKALELMEEIMNAILFLS